MMKTHALSRHSIGGHAPRRSATALVGTLSFGLAGLVLLGGCNKAPAPVTAAEPATPAPAAAAGSAKNGGKSKALAKQEQMQFEPVTRGRFEKSEPTIVDGQDLDVPTFLRRNVKVK